MGDNKKISVKIGADISQLEQATRIAAAKLSEFSGKLKSAGAAMLPVTGAVAALGAAFVAAGNDWDAAAKTIQTATGATGDKLDSLKQSAQNVFGNVPADAETVAAAIGTLNTHLGATGPVLESLTTQLVEVSRALGEDAAANADAFGTALNSFGISASEAGPQLDYLFTVTQDYGISLNQLLGQLNTFGPVLQNAGFSMAEAADFMGQLNQSGISVSRVMPALNKALRDAAAQGVTDLKSHLITATEAIANATDKSKALDQAVKIFGAEGAARMTAALQAGNVSLRDLASGFESAKGAIQANAEDTRTLADQWQIFKNQLEAAVAPIGVQLVGALQNLMESARPVLDWVRDAVEWFTNLPSPVQTAAAGIAALAAAIGPLSLALNGVMGTLSTLQTTVAAIGGAASLATPLLVAFGAAIAAWAIYKAVTKLQALNDEIERLEDLQRRGVRATDEQAQEIRILEGILDKHRITVDSTGKSVEEYLQALRDAAKGLYDFGEAGKSSMQVLGDGTIKIKLAADETNRLKNETDESNESTDEAAETTRRFNDELTTLRDTLARINEQEAGEKFVQDWIESVSVAKDWTEQFYRQVDEMKAAVEAATEPTYDLGAAMAEMASDQLQAPLDELPPKIEKTSDTLERNKDAWNVWSRQVSTIVSDFGRNVTDILFGLFDNSEKRAIEEQRDRLRQSLEERRQEWEEYQQDIAEQIAQLEADYQKTLAEEEQRLQDSLESRRQQYEQDRAELEQSLQDRIADYEAYKLEVADKIEELRRANAESLDEELSRLQDALDQKTEAFNEYVADVQKRLGRLREDYADAEEDKKRATDRRIEDATRRYKREEEDILERIERLRRAGKSADSQEIRDLKKKLARKKEDYEIFVRRQKEDLQDWIEENKRKLERQEQDLNESLNKRKADYQEYVAANKQKAQEITDDHKRKLQQQEKDLLDSLEQRKTDLEQFKIDTNTKIDELTAEWQTYQTDVTNELQTIKDNAKTKLDEQKQDLITKLNEQRAEWQSYRDDVYAQLEQLDKDEEGLSVWNKLKNGFTGMLTEMGNALTRSTIETWFDDLIKKITGEDGLLPGLDKLKTKLNEIFGLGGSATDTATNVRGNGPAPGGGGGGAGSGAGSGIGGLLGTVFAGVSAVSGVISNFQLARQETTLNAIELNTRRGTRYLGDREDGGIMTASLKTLEWLTYNVANTDNIKSTLWTIRDTLNDRLPNLAGAGGSDNGYLVTNTDDMKSTLWEIRDKIKDHLPGIAADVDASFDKLDDIAGQSNLYMHYLEKISTNTRGLLRQRQDINIDVHFDGLVAAVAKQVKTQIVTEYKLQKP